MTVVSHDGTQWAFGKPLSQHADIRSTLDTIVYPYLFATRIFANRTPSTVNVLEIRLLPDLNLDQFDGAIFLFFFFSIITLTTYLQTSFSTVAKAVTLTAWYSVTGKIEGKWKTEHAPQRRRRKKRSCRRRKEEKDVDEHKEEKKKTKTLKKKKNRRKKKEKKRSGTKL